MIGATNKMDTDKLILFIIGILSIVMILFGLIVGIKDQFDRQAFCEHEGGLYTSTTNCVKGNVIYQISQVGSIPFDSEYRLTKFAVSDK